MAELHAPIWATTPIDLSDQRTRRLFAQEFVTRLIRIGASTIEEMPGLGLSLFKIPPDTEEAKQVAEVARRLGWVEESSDGHLALRVPLAGPRRNDRGAARLQVPPPLPVAAAPGPTV